MGGANLITPASLQIKDAGNHLMETEGAVFIVVTRKDNITGLKRRTFQMAYVSPRAEDIVLSREAMETLGLVSNLDDRREASVRHISTTPADGGGTSLTPADGGGTSSTPADGGGTGSHISRQIKSTPAADRHRSVAPNGGGGNSGGGTTRDSSSGVPSSSQEYKQFGEYIGVPGGQLTMDLIAAHNQDNPSNQVSLADLKPNSDPDFQCRGTGALKTGFSHVGVMSERMLLTQSLIRM